MCSVAVGLFRTKIITMHRFTSLDFFMLKNEKHSQCILHTFRCDFATTSKLCLFVRFKMPNFSNFYIFNCFIHDWDFCKITYFTIAFGLIHRISEFDFRKIFFSAVLHCLLFSLPLSPLFDLPLDVVNFFGK